MGEGKSFKRSTSYQVIQIATTILKFLFHYPPRLFLLRSHLNMRYNQLQQVEIVLILALLTTSSLSIAEQKRKKCPKNQIRLRLSHESPLEKRRKNPSQRMLIKEI